MKIAVIGTGNVGGALATKWSEAGHTIHLGVTDTTNFKGVGLLQNQKTSVHPVDEAVRKAEVILIATPASAAVQVAAGLGDTTGKVIIDAMNIVRGNGPVDFGNTSEAILANTNSTELVKSFNTTGFNNMINPDYQDQRLDMFMAGDSVEGKAMVHQLALDAGFADCYDVGGNDKFSLMEHFANFWINLALFQGQGREIGFKLLKRP